MSDSDHTQKSTRPPLSALIPPSADEQTPRPRHAQPDATRTTITQGAMRLDHTDSAPHKEQTILGLKHNFAAKESADLTPSLDQTLVSPNQTVQAISPLAQAPLAPKAQAPMSLDQTIDMAPAHLLQDDSLAKTLASAPPTHNPRQTATISEAPTPIEPAPLTRKTTIRTTALPRVQIQNHRPSLRYDERERYHKVKPLGHGGMGDVLLVNDEDIDRQVAMKRLKHDDQHALVRFIDEIHTIGRLEHPNIIPIHDVGVDQDGSYFFIMKHVEGQTLEHIIDKLAEGDADYHARYTYDVRIQIFMDVLHAIDFAHAKNIIHRDIKPSNIMVGPHGEVIVMDWGLAKSLDEPGIDDPNAKTPIDLASTLPPDFFKNLGTLPPRQRMRLTQHGELLGTPAYMSPEQAKGDIANIDKRTDTYALSVLFHELMTLEHYLEGKDNLITMLHGVMHDTPSVMQMREGRKNPHTLPAEVGHFIHKGLTKDLDSRYADAQAMIQDLQRVIDGTFAVACAVTMMKRRSRDLSRIIDEHPQGVMLAILFFIASFVGMLAITTYSLVT